MTFGWQLTWYHLQIDEEDGGDQYSIEITITEPKKIGDGIGAYMAYKVCTKVSRWNWCLHGLQSLYKGKHVELVLTLAYKVYKGKQVELVLTRPTKCTKLSCWNWVLQSLYNGKLVELVLTLALKVKLLELGPTKSVQW